MLDGTGRDLSRLVCRLWEVGRSHDGRLDQESFLKRWRFSHQNSDFKDLGNFCILKITTFVKLSYQQSFSFALEGGIFPDASIECSFVERSCVVHSSFRSFYSTLSSSYVSILPMCVGEV